MAFVPPVFFHSVKETDLLKRFFDSRKITGFPSNVPRVTNKKEKKLISERILDFFNSLDEDDRKKAEDGLTAVDILGNYRGVATIQGIIRDFNIPVDDSRCLNYSMRDRALFYYLEREDVFEEAMAILEFQDLSGWKRYPVPKTTISIMESKKTILKEAFQSMFQGEGRGKTCWVDVRKIEEDSCATISFDDHPQVCTQMDKSGKPDRLAIFRALDAIYFLYLPKENELHVKAKGSWQARDEYLNVFLETVFGIPLEKARPKHNLRLIMKNDFEINADNVPDLDSWLLRSLHLRYTNTGKRVVLSMPPNDKKSTGADGIKTMAHSLGLQKALNNKEIYIDRACFSFRFKSQEAKGGIKAISFFIDWVDKCDLGMIDEFEKKACRILKDTGIDEGFDA